LVIEHDVDNGIVAPLRDRAFRVLWIIQLAGQLVTWTHTVAAQWILTEAGEPPLIVASVTAAATLPFFLFGLIAGTVADLGYGRRMLLIVQPVLAAATAAIAVLSFTSLLTPLAVIIGTCALGTCAAFTTPAVTAAIPSVLDRKHVVAGLSLISINANGSRIIGPMIAGLLLTIWTPTAAFLFNFIVVCGSLSVVSRWPKRMVTTPGLTVRAALRAGFGYVRHAREFQLILLLTLLFVMPATAVWSIIPVVAHRYLRLNGNGYGLLFGCLGAGAILAAVFAPRIQIRVNQPLLLLALSIADGLATITLGLTSIVAVAAVGLVVIGGTWMLTLNTFTSTSALLLPPWVRGRGLATWYMVLYGSQALGSALWGSVAASVNPQFALICAGAVLPVFGIVALVLRRPRRPEASVVSIG
jgi:MFS family permease